MSFFSKLESRSVRDNRKMTAPKLYHLVKGQHFQTKFIYVFTEVGVLKRKIKL